MLAGISGEPERGESDGQPPAMASRRRQDHATEATAAPRHSPDSARRLVAKRLIELRLEAVELVAPLRVNVQAALEAHHQAAMHQRQQVAILRRRSQVAGEIETLA